MERSPQVINPTPSVISRISEQLGKVASGDHPPTPSVSDPTASVDQSARRQIF
jgi:hypothetical protein